MSAAAILSKGTNTIEGNLELKIYIRNITTINATAQQIVQLKELAAKITTIEIDTSTFFQAVEEQEDLAGLFSAGVVCPHLIIILDAIKIHGGGLTAFSWPASQHTHEYFTRPQEFWTALYAHASTFQTLHLDFFCHEVHTVPCPPPSVTFEAKDLRLDTSSAHGDNGAAIDTILKVCSNTSTLHFEWPPCDLESCQIRNVSWAWHFPQLKHLRTFGWNFAPATYTNFLVRHPNLTSIAECLDGPWHSGEGEAVQVRLPTAALPNLRVLEKRYAGTHGLRDYFDTTANRQIDALVVHVNDFQGVEQELLEIAVLPTAQRRLRTLEFRGKISCWRRREREDSSEDDSADETPEQRDQRLQHAEKIFQAREQKRLPAILKSVLPHLTSLETLSIEMDSSNGIYDSEASGTTYPEPMSRRDFHAILDLLPKSKEGRLKVLRLEDARATADPRSGRIREWICEMNDEITEGEAVQGSLRTLEWCGQQSSVIELG